MRLALHHARGDREDEGSGRNVPIAAVLVVREKRSDEPDNVSHLTVFKAVNGEQLIQHAELRALLEASEYYERTESKPFHRLGVDKGDGVTRSTTLYVTLEPCSMCWGAIRVARLGRVVTAAAFTSVSSPFHPTSKSKRGGDGSREIEGDDDDDDVVEGTIEVRRGVRREEASRMLREYFRERRKSA